MAKKKLITSALPYVNNSPHLGNIIGCVLSADVFDRFCRSRDYETLYVCGTDEYGTATETKAREENVSPKELCDKFYKIHKKVYEYFNISFDIFGRTSDEGHSGVVQEFYHKAEENNFLTEEETEQAFCLHCSTFLADRFIVGHCPHCAYDKAKGDQCEHCGKLLNPSDLKDPLCTTCHNTPALRKTKHLYLALDKLSEALKDFQEKSIQNGRWTLNAITTTKSWMDLGLKPRPITRDLKWGVRVPRTDYENKVFYVWFDAPIGYVSITKQALPESWESWWLNPENTELYQFMAKDNIPFHSVIFPASQLSTGHQWTMLHHLNATEYLNYEKGKFSKSQNRGVFGTDVLELPIAVDLWRYYLLAIRPENQDSQFSWDEFFEKVNSEFIDNIANLVNRVLVFLVKSFSGKIVSCKDLDESQKQFLHEVENLEKEMTQRLESVQLREGLKHLMMIGKLANKFFQDEEPWKKIKEDKEKVHKTMSLLVYTIKDIAIMISPYMPETGEKIFALLGISPCKWSQLAEWDSLSAIEIVMPQILHSKLDVKMVGSLREKFSGG